jgi:transcriptional regulator with XRE-family HTH domain
MSEINSDEYRKIIGENVKFWRNIRGLKQEFIGKKLGLNRSYISKIESGEANPTLDYLQKLADILQVEIEDLITHQPYRDLVMKLYEDKSINPPLNDKELKDLLSIRFRSKKPNLNYFYFVLDLLRGGKTFFSDEDH